MRTACSCRSSGQRRFLLLAPPNGEAPEHFCQIQVDQNRSRNLLAEMQRLRGRIYLEDGAVGASELSDDGRHQLRDDVDSWHLLIMDDSERVLGCMRYRHYTNRVAMSQLGVSSSALAQCDKWGRLTRKAVESDIGQARKEGISVGEAGGWALAEELRCSTEALRMVLATYSLSQLLGDALVFSTATMRNGSASMLRRIGGTALHVDDTDLPNYYDPHYRCEMQVLRFDSRAPNQKYQNWVHQLRADLLAAPVIAARPTLRPAEGLIVRYNRTNWAESIR